MKALPIPDRTVPADLVVLSAHDLMKLLDVHRTTLWKLRQKPDFPKPVQLTRRMLSWRAVDVQRWLEQRLAKEGATNEKQ